MVRILFCGVVCMLLFGCASDPGAVGPGRVTGAEGTASGSSGNATGTGSTGADVYGQPGATPQ